MLTGDAATYPLDLIRSRISIATARVGKHVTQAELAQNAELGLVGMSKRVIAESGFRGLYSGMVVTSLGVAPYVGLNFCLYELFRGIVLPDESQQTVSIVRKLGCVRCAMLSSVFNSRGSLSSLYYRALWRESPDIDPHCTANNRGSYYRGAVSQTLTYPVDVLRRRLQVVGMKELVSRVSVRMHEPTLSDSSCTGLSLQWRLAGHPLHPPDGRRAGHVPWPVAQPSQGRTSDWHQLVSLYKMHLLSLS